MHHWDAIAVPD